MAVAHQAAGLGPTAGLAPGAGQPERSLGAQQAAVAPFAVEEGVEALWVERPPRPVGAGGDAVGFGLRLVLAAQFFEPARRAGGPLEVEAAGVEYLSSGTRPMLMGRISASVLSRWRMAVSSSRSAWLMRSILLMRMTSANSTWSISRSVMERFVVFTQGFATAGQALGLVEVAQEVHPSTTVTRVSRRRRRTGRDRPRRGR